MQSKFEQAQRLCVALEQMLDASDTSQPVDASLTERTQLIVNRLALLAEESSVRKNLRATIRGILDRWQQLTARRGQHLAHLRGELNAVEQGRQRLACLALTYRTSQLNSRLHATA